MIPPVKHPMRHILGPLGIIASTVLGNAHLCTRHRHPARHARRGFSQV